MAPPQTLLCEMISSFWEREQKECCVKHQSIKMEINCFTISRGPLLRGLPGVSVAACVELNERHNV